jgi:hypothetical protein
LSSFDNLENAASPVTGPRPDDTEGRMITHYFRRLLCGDLVRTFFQRPPLAKQFPVHDRLALEIRPQAFNVMNSLNFIVVNNI